MRRATTRLVGAILLLASIVALSGGYAPNFGYTAEHEFGAVSATTLIGAITAFVLGLVDPKVIEDRPLRAHVEAIRKRITAQHRRTPN